MVSWQSFVVFGFEPIFFNSSAARKGLGITLSKDRDTKDQIMEWVEVVTGQLLARRTVKAGKKKGQVVYDKGVNDAADAYVMARAAYLLKP
jgi:chloramphenicol 3-O-phosphotransferase